MIQESKSNNLGMMNLIMWLDFTEEV